jgi:hypothetical protein
MKLIRLVIVMLVLSMLSLSVIPAYADTPDPDDVPSIVEVDAYRNSIEADDMLVIIYANIPYATIPDTPVTETFIWSLMDGAVEFGSTVGTNYNDDGYGYNVYSMYFSAAEVVSLGIVWGDVYTIRLAGNPAVFDTPPIYNFTLTAADYSTETVRVDVQAAIAARVLTIAADLDNKWLLGALGSLITQNETATVLSIFGEAFFRGAIHGLQSMAPNAFSVVVRVIDLEDREWDTEYAENVTDQWAGTWVETGKAAGAALFGTDYDLLSIILMVGLSVGLFFGNMALTGDSWNAMVDVAAWGIIGARLAMYDLAFLMLAVGVCWIYVSAIIWFRLFR